MREFNCVYEIWWGRWNTSEKKAISYSHVFLTSIFKSIFGWCYNNTRCVSASHTSTSCCCYFLLAYSLSIVKCARHLNRIHMKKKHIHTALNKHIWFSNRYNKKKNLWKCATESICLLSKSIVCTRVCINIGPKHFNSHRFSHTFLFSFAFSLLCIYDWSKWALIESNKIHEIVINFNKAILLFLDCK